MADDSNNYSLPGPNWVMKTLWVGYRIVVLAAFIFSGQAWVTFGLNVNQFGWGAAWGYSDGVHYWLARSGQVHEVTAENLNTWHWCLGLCSAAGLAAWGLFAAQWVAHRRRRKTAG